jgi:GH25 family lysozyme M1 (1,4-beta-N-acetylmuramidase)
MSNATLEKLKAALVGLGGTIPFDLPSGQFSISAPVLLAAITGQSIPDDPTYLIIPDISHHNADPTNYAGAPAVFLKATQGNYFKDETFQARHKAFQGAGTLAGAYHFLVGDVDPEVQAQYFLDFVQHDGKTALAVDFETIKPEAGLTATVDQLLKFCAYIYDHTGTWILIYTRPNMIPENAPVALAAFPLWIASQPIPPVIPKPWKGCRLQQFKQGDLPGIGSGIDLSRFEGSVDDLKRFWADLSPKIVVPAPKVLDVPYDSQEAADARQYANDCGPACVHMMLDWQADQAKLPRPNLTTNQLSAETTLATNDVGLSSAALVALAARHGLALRVIGGVNQSYIQSQIDHGYPMICLIAYGPIRGRENQRDTGGHFVVPTGYDAQNVYINDPDWWAQGNITPEMGHNFKVPWDQFNAALAQSPVPNQGCIMLAFIATPMIVAWYKGMNIRKGPSADTDVIGELTFGQTVIVDLTQQTTDKNGNVLVPIQGGGWVGLKTATRAYLVPKGTWVLPFDPALRGIHGPAGGTAPTASTAT